MWGPMTRTLQRVVSETDEKERKWNTMEEEEEEEEGNRRLYQMIP